MNIAFLYIAEAYQCYHGAAIAQALAARPGIAVTTWYNDPETPRHLERIRAATGAPNIPQHRLVRGALTRALQSLRVAGLFQSRVLRENLHALNRHDAIVVMEKTAIHARRDGLTHPRMIYTPHGFGDRARGFDPCIAQFDFVLVAGPKTEARMLGEHLIRPGAYALTGSVKLQTAAALRTHAAPLFAHPAPIVLYNPHKARGLSSWSRFIEPMLAQFAGAPDLNLVVAPHIKKFRRRGRSLRRRWEARARPNILVDTGSSRCLDNSYTEAADIYVGDVSSQLYEFLARPRPCVFLNAHRIDWQHDPSFAHWHLGDVVEDPAALLDTIRDAPARHHLYRARQQERAAATLGSLGTGRVHPDCADRAADAILAFLHANPPDAAPA